MMTVDDKVKAVADAVENGQPPPRIDVHPDEMDEFLIKLKERAAAFRAKPTPWYKTWFDTLCEFCNLGFEWTLRGMFIYLGFWLMKGVIGV